ncbi:MAG: thioredoxin family protein [Desulfobacterales bacterium]|nr:thioredoxin family protein [Desulfobacterales bacterium]
MKRICKKNYIPSSVKETYAKAFLREFKKLLGKPYEEEPSTGTEIKVLGQGCARCNKLMQELMEVAAEIDLQASMEHITDIKEIGTYGVMGMPALLINDKVMSVGQVPAKSKLTEWLMEVKK